MNQNRADWTLSHIGDLDSVKFDRDDELKFRKQAIYVGRHHYKGGEFECSESLIDHWVDTGRKMLKDGIKIPLPKEHTEDSEANRGWITGFAKRKDSKGRPSLYLSGKVRDEETKKTIKANDISLYSPVAADVAGKTWHRPILHACITSYPIVKGLEGFEMALAMDGMKEETEDAEAMESESMGGYEFNPDCPACQANKRKMEMTGLSTDGYSMAPEGYRPVRRLLAFSEPERIDEEIAQLRQETGERVYVCRDEGQTLLLTESARTPEDKPELCIG